MRALLVCLALLLGAAAAPAQERIRLHVRLVGVGDVRASVYVTQPEAGQPPRSPGWRPGRPRVDWEVDPAPLDVLVRSRETFPVDLRGIDPTSLPEAEVEGFGAAHLLEVELVRRPRLIALVRSMGRPVSRVRAWFAPVERSSSMARYELADAGPEFPVSGREVRGDPLDLPVPRAGRYTLRVWSGGAGYAESLPFEVDEAGATTLPEPVALDLDPTLAWIEGRLRVPEGVDPTTVAVEDSSSGCWWSVEADGRFLVPGGPPGVRVLQVVDLVGPYGDDSTLEDLEPLHEDPPVETPAPEPEAAAAAGARAELERFLRPAGRNVTVSDGTPADPPWNASGTTLRYLLEPGPREPVVLDLSAPAPCRLTGHFEAPCELPPGLEENYWVGGHGPRVTLERRDYPGHAARTDLAPDGRFELAVFEPGRYRLRLDLARDLGPGLVIDEWLELEGGTRAWSLALETGEVILEPALDDVSAAEAPDEEPSEAPTAPRSVASHLVWRAPDARERLVRVFPRRVDSLDGIVVAEPGRFPWVPAGKVAVLPPPDERLPDAGDRRPPLATFEVRAGVVNRAPVTWPRGLPDGRR